MPRILRPNDQLGTKAASSRSIVETSESSGKVVVGALIIAGLYLGREVFVPVALAIIFSFVLAPLVKLLQRGKLPRSVAVITVVALASTILAGLAMAMIGQATQLAGQLPIYQNTIREKIGSLRVASPGSKVLSRAADVLQDLGKELDGRTETNLAPQSAPKVQARPIPVEVHQPEPTALETLRAFLTPLIPPLTTTGIVLIFVIFVLLQREDLRNRFIRLTGTSDLQKTTAAFDDAAKRLSRLFLTQLLLNTGFGVVIGAGLWLIGIPSALLWGILAAILRFVPYVGAILSAVFPMVIAAAVDPGWTMLACTAALFFVTEPIAGHVIEPLVYGRSTGLSPVAIIVAATFWTWLWGPIGLILATPLTVCLVVLGRHVDRLEFLDVLLGDRPALSAPEVFYQRVLAGDPAEATDKAEEILKERSLSAYYDEVALEGLRLAAADASRDVLDPDRQSRILHSVCELVDNLSEHDGLIPHAMLQARDAEAGAAIDETEGGDVVADLPQVSTRQIATLPGEKRVVCIGAQSPIDEAAAVILVQILGRHGLAVRSTGPEAISSRELPALVESSPAMICLCYLNVRSAAHMRYTVKRLRRQLPGAFIVLAALANEEPAQDHMSDIPSDETASTLRDVSKVCLTWAAKSG